MKWEKTKTAHLLRNSDSGTYYARLYRDGKQIWRSLKTNVYSVAQARLSEQASTIRQAAHVTRTVATGSANMSAMFGLYLAEQNLRPDIKPKTKHYREECVVRIQKTWPGLGSMKPQAVSQSAVVVWASKLDYSGTVVNNAIDTLHDVFEVAIKHGLVFKNPIFDIPRRKASKKHLQLPSREQFQALVDHIRNQGAWCSRQCGDLVEFLTYSGCRIGEAKNVRWSDVQENGIWVHGDPVTGTKGGESRRIPITAPLRVLLDDLRANPRLYRADGRDASYVLSVCDCTDAVWGACRKLGIKKMTHHDFRHLFATRSIESGVDVPTVAKWLGHKDGGALLMRTYSHLLDDHSQAMAARVAF